MTASIASNQTAFPFSHSSCRPTWRNILRALDVSTEISWTCADNGPRNGSAGVAMRFACYYAAPLSMTHSRRQNLVFFRCTVSLSFSPFSLKWRHNCGSLAHLHTRANQSRSTTVRNHNESDSQFSNWINWDDVRMYPNGTLAAPYENMLTW